MTLLDPDFQKALTDGPYLPSYDPESLERILFALSSFDTNLDQYMTEESEYDGINFYFRAVDAIYHQALQSVKNGFYDLHDYERHSEAIDFHRERIRTTMFPTKAIRSVYDNCDPFLETVRTSLFQFTTPSGQLKIHDPDSQYPRLAQALARLDARSVAVGPSRDPERSNAIVLWSRQSRTQITVSDEARALDWIQELPYFLQRSPSTIFLNESRES